MSRCGLEMCYAINLYSSWLKLTFWYWIGGFAAGPWWLAAHLSRQTLLVIRVMDLRFYISLLGQSLDQKFVEGHCPLVFWVESFKTMTTEDFYTQSLHQNLWVLPASVRQVIAELVLALIFRTHSKPCRVLKNHNTWYWFKLRYFATKKKFHI